MAQEPIPIYKIKDFKQAESEGSHFYINSFSKHLKQRDFIAHPHSHDFYLVVYFSKGKGKHIIDFNAYDVIPGSIFFLSPGQVHSFSMVEEGMGTILFFSKEFPESYFNGKKVADYLLFRGSGQALYLEEKDAKWLEGILVELDAEYTNPQGNSSQIILDYLDIFLQKLGRSVEASPRKISGTTAVWQLRKLESLIDTYYLTHHKASDYAEMLHLSTKYLNELCKKHLGKTTSALIQSRLILEAKRLLVYEANTINHIASRLEFEDASYFVRFFKKETGITPERFRKEQLGDIN